MALTKTKITWDIAGGADISIDGAEAIHYDGTSANLELAQGSHTVEIVASNGASKTLTLVVPEAIEDRVADKVAEKLAIINTIKHYNLLEVNVRDNILKVQFESEVSTIAVNGGVAREPAGLESFTHGVDHTVVMFDSNNTPLGVIDVAALLSFVPTTKDYINMEYINLDNTSVVGFTISRSKTPDVARIELTRLDDTQHTLGLYGDEAHVYSVNTNVDKAVHIYDANDKLLDSLDLEFNTILPNTFITRKSMAYRIGVSKEADIRNGGRLVHTVLFKPNSCTYSLDGGDADDFETSEELVDYYGDGVMWLRVKIRVLSSTLDASDEGYKHTRLKAVAGDTISTTVIGIKWEQ